MKEGQKDFVEQIALERIYRLFELAEKELNKNPDRSKRYVQLARAIGKRNRARIPKELKPKFCKKCNVFLKKDINADIERIGSMLIIKCKECSFERKLGA